MKGGIVSNKKPNKRQKFVRIIVSLIITTISVVILYRLVTQNIGVLTQIRYSLNWWLLLLVIPLFALNEILASFAWGKVMNDMSVQLSFIEHIRIFIVSHAGRRLPGSLWHVVGRVVWYEQLGIGRVVTSFASILEALLMLWSGLIITVLLLPFLPGGQQQNRWLFLLGILAIVFIMHPRILAFVLSRAGYGDQARKLNYQKIFIWLGLYVPIWLVGGVMMFLIIRSLYPLPVSLIPAIAAIWCLVGVIGLLILVVPAGLGISEASLSLLLSTMMPSAIAVACALLARLVFTILEFFFAGIVYIVFSKQINLSDADQEKIQ